MGANGPLLTGWLPDADKHPLWPGIHDLLKPAADFGACEVLNPHDEVWIAVADGLVIGAVTARGLTDGTAEIMNVGGIKARAWWPLIEAEICEWAKENGAGTIRSQGRRGWLPWIVKAGWRCVRDDGQRMFFEKDL